MKISSDILKLINANVVRKGLILKHLSMTDATIIAAPSSTKNRSVERDPEMHQAKKGNQWHFSINAHIAHWGLVYAVRANAANEADVNQIADLLHCKEEQVWADSDYRGRGRACPTRGPAVAHRRRTHQHCQAA